jgi:hypothetical protein
MIERRRNWRGRFIKRLRDTPEGSGEWLIWSRYRGAWHRNSAGLACGYTTDIAEAGLFPRSKAIEYHDGDRNEPFHISEKMDEITRAIAAHDRKLAKLSALARAGMIVPNTPEGDG